MKQVFASVALFAASASAISVWGQCAGINWGGSGTCDAGTTCIYINDYYSQCQPGSAASTAVTATSRPASTVASTLVTSVAQSSARPSSGTTTSAPPTTVSGNPFAGKQIYANPYYSSEIHSLAIPSLPSSLQARASSVAKVGTYVWLDVHAKVPTVDTYLSQIRAQNKAGANPPIIGAFVVYDLPNRDCAALASNGEYLVANNGLNNYYSYINDIAAIIKNYPDVSISLIIEPDSLANLVTNLNVAKCQEAQPAYEAGVAYAIKTLNFPNVASYLDAGHAGWLGWPANIGPAADLFAKVYKAAGSPSSVRGLATNVANYNSWDIATAPSYTQGNKNFNEKLYINALAPLLTAAGYPAHFVVDVGRNGVQPTQQQEWGHWCNVKGTGFGVRPTTNTGDPLVDSFVWIKPGGECDGTSNSSAVRYDAHCGYSDALQPAPEAGQWFQAYFQQLLQNANPAFT